MEGSEDKPPVWARQTVSDMANGYLVNCGGIHCYRLMHPYRYACCGKCSSSREKGKATTEHSHGCDENHAGRVK